jgi:hypothetical protein
MLGNVAASALAARHIDTADAGGAPERMGMRAQLRCISRKRSLSQSEQTTYSPISAAASAAKARRYAVVRRIQAQRNRAETDGGRLDKGRTAYPRT